MIRSQSEWSTDVRELFAQERQIPAVPPAVRERALSRAREALVEMAASPPVGRRPLRILRWAVAVAVLCVASAAGGVAAYKIAAYTQARATAGVVAPRTPESVVDRGASDVTVEDPRLAAPPSFPVSRQTRRVERDEMRLLEEARSALDGDDFSGAMVP